jgi:hypothetical protein
MMLHMATQMNRGGRKPKGNRTAISCRVPADQKPLFEEAAREAGMPLGDYVAVILAEHHGFPVPDYLLPQSKGQEELPISA